MIKTEVNSNINLLILQKAGIRRGNNLEIKSDQNPGYSRVSSETKNHRKTPLRILVLAPHQDDEEFTAATMMQLPRESALVFYAFYTDGREGQGEYSRRLRLTPEQLVEQREADKYYVGDTLVSIPPYIMYQTLLALRKHVSQFAKNTELLSKILLSKATRGAGAGNGVEYADTYTLAHQSSKNGDSEINPFSLLLPYSVYQKVNHDNQNPFD